MPLTPEAAPEPRDFDAMRVLLSGWTPATGPIVLSDQNGQGRATVALLSALLIAHYKGALPLAVPPDANEMYALALLFDVCICSLKAVVQSSGAAVHQHQQLGPRTAQRARSDSARELPRHAMRCTHIRSTRQSRGAHASFG